MCRTLPISPVIEQTSENSVAFVPHLHTRQRAGRSVHRKQHTMQNVHTLSTGPETATGRRPFPQLRQLPRPPQPFIRRAFIYLEVRENIGKRDGRGGLVSPSNLESTYMRSLTSHYTDTLMVFTDAMRTKNINRMSSCADLHLH